MIHGMSGNDHVVANYLVRCSGYFLVMKHILVFYVEINGGTKKINEKL